jgi:hypothetical protein
MTRRVPSRAVTVLVVLVAVLLPAGVLAAGNVALPPSADSPVGAAGLGQESVGEEATAPATVHVTAPPPAPPSPASTSAPGPTTTVTTAPTTRTTVRGTPAPTMPPGAPLPPLPPAPPFTGGIPNIQPATSWSDQRDGVSARMRIEPAAPVAGQPVRFVLDVASADPCCRIMLDFGDGSTGFAHHNGGVCGDPPRLAPGPHQVVATHTYAAAGAFKAALIVLSGDPCATTFRPGEPPPPPFTGSVGLTGCIAVGPGPAGQAGCSPFPTFGPDAIVSPVLDPFCQIRSDCTKASPPR